MSEVDVLHTILESGLEGAGIIFLLVLAYKLYKIRIRTRSNCCDDSFNIETTNDGDTNNDIPPI